jgi:hypothetical protein
VSLELVKFAKQPELIHYFVYSFRNKARAQALGLTLEDMSLNKLTKDIPEQVLEALDMGFIEPSDKLFWQEYTHLLLRFKSETRRSARHSSI